MTTLEGEFVCRRHEDGRVEVVEAPPTTRISLEFVHAADPAVVKVSGRLVTIGGQVTYRVTGWDSHGQALLAGLAEDRRPKAGG